MTGLTCSGRRQAAAAGRHNATWLPVLAGALSAAIFAHRILSSARSIAARASSAESCVPPWMWRFRNFSVITRSADRYGGPCVMRYDVAHSPKQEAPGECITRHTLCTIHTTCTPRHTDLHAIDCVTRQRDAVSMHRLPALALF
jgi:hypothetical protein